MKTLILLFLTLVMFSCKNASDTRDEKRLQDSLDMVDNVTVDVDTVDNTNPAQNEYAEFTVTKGNVVLRPRLNESSVDFTGLGTPNDTLTRKMTLTTDAHKGATVREYKYDDVNLTFLIPEGTRDSWLMTAEIKGGPWSTARGIKVGDSVADLQAMYPNITAYTDPDKVYAYNYTLDDSTILFGINADKVSRIKIMYDIH